MGGKGVPASASPRTQFSCLADRRTFFSFDLKKPGMCFPSTRKAGLVMSSAVHVKGGCRG